MDNTLYNLKGGSFKNSLLNKKIKTNAAIFLSNELKISQQKASNLIKKIIQRRGENISIALEKMFGIDRSRYFNIVWDVSPDKFIIKNNNSIKNLLDEIASSYNFILVSDSPSVWIKNVLQYLEIHDIFKGKIYNGEGDERKIFYNIFEKIVKDLEVPPKDCMVIGDQEGTDIIPAKKLEIKTVIVGKNNHSDFADFQINDIFKLKNILNKAW